jgi:TRAP transporter 4TM/12TM fusion protein
MYEKLNKFEKIVFSALSVFLVVFYVVAAVWIPAPTEYHRGIYVLITYILVFMLYKSSNPLFRVLDYVLMTAASASVIYWIYNYENLNYRAGMESELDQYIAAVGVILGIEIARRAVGFVFVIIGVVMLVYGVFGEYAPDLIMHPGDSFLGVCTTIFFREDGVFGIMANVLATYVLLFVLFGAFLEQSGAQKFFIDFPLAAVGHKTGGPAKVAVIASAMFGSISGSAIANTVSTGAFTIPLMKKAGFRPQVAGAIEPAASIGGMFMPPIMGAGGFIMAELTGVNYAYIMLIAIFPAVMYFFSVFVMVHYEAKAHNITGDKSARNAMQIFKEEWYYMAPLIIITVLMLYGYSAGFAAVVGIGTCIAVSWVKDNESRIKFKGFVNAAVKGTESSLKIGATVGIIGIIISMLTFSGLILTFADIVIQLADGSLVLTIGLIALASLVLGMGVPVTAAYLITAVVAVPALTHLGVNPIAAHMIVYWLSQDSNISPPVCIAAFAGAAIAKAPMWPTAFNAFKFAKFLYVAPFLFAYVPAFSLNPQFEYDTFTGISLDWTVAMWFAIIIAGNFAVSYFLSFSWYYNLKNKYATSKV